MNSRVVYVADSEEQAWRDTRAALMYQAELYGRWLSAAAGTTDQSKVLIRPDADRLRRTSVLGTASEVAAQLEQVFASTPMTELIVVMQLPGLVSRQDSALAGQVRRRSVTAPQVAPLPEREDPRVSRPGGPQVTKVISSRQNGDDLS